MSEIMDTYKEKKARENKTDIPVVNAEALNRIMVESDDNNEDGKLFTSLEYSLNSLQEELSEDESPFTKGKRAPEARENAQKLAFGSAPEKVVKGMEVSIAENNQELIQSIINKKVNENIRNFDLENMTATQIRLQIKALADSAVSGFRALKGYVSDTYVNNQVAAIMKKLKAKKSEINTLDLFGYKATPQEVLDQSSKTAVDYGMIESALLKSYEQASDEIQNRTTEINQLNQENFKLKREIAGYQEQVAAIIIHLKVIIDTCIN